MEWARGGNALTALVRSISSYTDDQNQKRIRKHVTLDSHASLVLPGTAGFSGIEPVLTFGVLNIFDKDPPRVDTTVGYDSKVHDPRGRVIYIGLKSNL
jgi:iron complex outermembrane receptor protein